MKIKYISIFGLIVIFVGSQFIPANIYPYVLFPTIFLLAYALIQKINSEKKQGMLNLKRYLPMLIGLLISAGIFIFYFTRI